MKNKNILALAGRLQEEGFRKQMATRSPAVSNSGNSEIIQELSADLWKIETQKKSKVQSQTN